LLLAESLSKAAFIRANTRVTDVPLVPELNLYLADETTAIWQATEDQLEHIGVPAPFWAFAWVGGQALARHLLDHPELVRGRRVLDVASGSGLVAFAAVRAGAAVVQANEIDPFACAAIAMNEQLNRLGKHIDILSTDLLDQGREAIAPVDVITAGDVCYEAPMAARMIPWLRMHAAAGVTVLLADPGRAYLPKQGLTALAKMNVPTVADVEDDKIRSTTVWQVLPPS
jgi:predicted nicotinamide N-methyase